ncbi:MAG: hypothetical protein GY757_18180 [bacterium]|nr:hypothetical protein [bacterium]
MKKKTILVSLALLSLILITLALLSQVYPVIDQKASETGTTAKQWLQGYLGVFFSFKYLGNLNWLLIPLAIWHFVTTKKREPWQAALLFVYVGITLLIGLKGYYNPRYQLTLLPVTATLLLLLVWKLLEDKKKYLKITVLTILALLCFYNIHHYFKAYKFFWDVNVSMEKIHFPYKLMEYLNDDKNLQENRKTLVINRPIFYYYTTKKGLDYRDGKINWHMNRLLLRETGVKRRRLFAALKKSFKIDYILLKTGDRKIYNKGMLNEFLDCECNQVIRDNGWLLYKLRRKALDKIFQSPGSREIPVWKPKKKHTSIKEISPKLFRLSRSGMFKFTVGKRKIVAVRNTLLKKGKKRRISVGFEFNRRRSVKEKIPEGHYLHFQVTLSIPPHLMDKNNYIYISDLSKGWDSVKTKYTTSKWRTYLVSKKITPGSTRLIAGIRYTPKSSKEQLLIKDMKLHITDKPLEEL